MNITFCTKALPKHLFYFISLVLICTPLLAEDKLPSASAHGLSFLAPKGHWGVRMEARTNSYDQLYDTNKNKFSLGSELNNVNLDSLIFPAIAALGPTASLGQTLMDAEVNAKRLEMTLGYGITDDLTLGLIIPFGKVKTRANFTVAGGNVGFNPTFDNTQVVSSTNFPFAPSGGATPPVGTEGVQSILGNPAFGLGYKPIKNSSWSGLGDPTIGLLWRFYKSKSSELVLGSGIRFGITDENDPNDLLDLQIDDGSTDIRTRLEYYRDLGKGFDLKLQVEHDTQLKDKVTMRVPQPGQLLASANSIEKLNRNLGDYWEYDVGLGKSFGNWRMGATWHHYRKSSDSYNSSIGTNTSALAANTKLHANQLQASISWSGIDAWKRGKIPMPLIVKLEIQETYKGKNFPDVRDVYLQVTSFF